MFVLGHLETGRAEPLDSPKKWRILVDKTFMHLNNELPLRKKQVHDIAEAGFNVIVPRRGGSDIDFLEKCARWAEEEGVAFMPWMRGTLPSEDGPEMVWGDGKTTPICSPTSDRLWNWLTRRVTSYARLGRRVDSVIGVFLDYEIYSQPKSGNAYSLSYDGKTIEEFAREQGIDPPSLRPSKRREWLRDRGLHEEFSAFQVKRWRIRCRRLRAKVDKIHPEFRFCVYPAPGTPFIKKAICQEWATDQAPLILADHSAYGRRGTIPHKLALEANRRVFARNDRSVVLENFPHDYIGGIDPKVEGADPEFSGKNALMQAQVADGYWVFYEGPTQPSWQDRVPYFTPGPADHEAYMKWFTWANRRIDSGDMDAWKEPRQTRDRVGRPAQSPGLSTLRETGADWTEPALREAATRLRGSGAYYIRGRSGHRIRLFMHGHQLGDYEDIPGYLLYAPGGEMIKQGKIPLGKRVTAAFTPEEDGLYQLITYSRQNCASVRPDASHWVMVPAGFPESPTSLSICQFAPRLYFYVREGTATFTVEARSPRSNAERAAVQVLDPMGRTVADGESKRTVRLPISVAEGQDGKVWSLAIEEPRKGILEDVDLRLEGVPPLLAESPDALLVPGE